MAGGGLRIVRSDREDADGYRNELVPGLKASADAEHLAEELAFAAARLAQLAADPTGVYADIAAEPNREEATWLAFLVAYLGPAEPAGARPGTAPTTPPGDPFAGIRAARTAWGTGELPVLEGVPTGPRTAHDPSRGNRTLVAYCSWARRAGSQAGAFTGESSWAPERRFERVFERLALPGLHRAARFELLTLLGRLGVYELRADGLHVGAGGDIELAAKRVFGIGERAVLERRAADLAEAAELPLEALDLGLLNWARVDGRVTLGATASADEPTRVRVRSSLGLGAAPRC
ncbi:MAG: hypothetical protein ACR2ML_09030 [Solirubrobacteraceae bacterium]